MKWHWVIVWGRTTSDGDEGGEIKSRPFASEQEARTNLDARMNQSVPDVRIPHGAYIASYSVELR